MGEAKYHLVPNLGIMIGIRPQVDVDIGLQVGLLLLSNFKRMFITFSWLRCKFFFFNFEKFWIRFLELK